MKTNKITTLPRRVARTLFEGRGTLDYTPDGLRPFEEAVGQIKNGCGILIRNKRTGGLRVAWVYRYMLSLGLCSGNGSGAQYVVDNLPLIVIN